MKRLTRRTLGAVLGLILGWLAAGLVYPVGSVSLAADAPHAENDAHHDDHAHGHHDTYATKLVPHDAEGHAATPDWFGTVIKLIAALFVAAIVIGIPALRAKGGDPAGLASAHDQSHAHHDDHAHGDDGHSHGDKAHAH